MVFVKNENIMFNVLFLSKYLIQINKYQILNTRANYVLYCVLCTI